jgi:hypothetical protein
MCMCWCADRLISTVATSAGRSSLSRQCFNYVGTLYDSRKQCRPYSDRRPRQCCLQSEWTWLCGGVGAVCPRLKARTGPCLRLVCNKYTRKLDSVLVILRMILCTSATVRLSGWLRLYSNNNSKISPDPLRAPSAILTHCHRQSSSDVV